ncbi:MAG: tyrosine-protein kinase [Actinomycetota bacterium]|nr:tyrosine-protein kinase [Actinomycetota bacterium]
MRYSAVPLAAYVRILRRHALLIILATALGAGGALLATHLQHKVYRSTAQLIVAVAGTDQQGNTVERRPAAVLAAKSLSELAGTPPAVRAAQQAAGLPGAATGNVQAFADGASPILTIRVTGPDPEQGARLANGFAGTLPTVAQQLHQTNAGERISLETLSPATVNPVPVSPRPKRNLALGLVLGLVVGLSGAFARTALDRQLRDSADIEEATGLPVLGAVPNEFSRERLPAATQPSSMRAEAYRLVRTNLQFTDVAEAPRTILVTSAAPGEGKTSLVVNLAVSCALAGETVVVVDADLRKPRVAYHFGIGAGVGLSTLLAAADADPTRFVHRGATGLVSVLPSGPAVANPSELLGSPSMHNALAVLAEHFDRVIVDAPPVLPVADGVKLASMVSGVIIVARMGATTRDALVSACQRLEKGSARILGVVANGVEPGRDQAYGYGAHGAYSYAASPRRAARLRGRWTRKAS